MMRKLLIIGCSERKSKLLGFRPAIDRYDGPTYRILRKMHREVNFPENVDVLIISAKYGLISLYELIEDYDQCMTAERAAELAPIVQELLTGEIIGGNGNGDGTLGIHFYKYDEAFIHLGKTYRQTLEGFHWGLIRTLEASGGIGLKNRQMKVWLERAYLEEQTDEQ